MVQRARIAEYDCLDSLSEYASTARVRQKRWNRTYMQLRRVISGNSFENSFARRVPANLREATEMCLMLTAKQLGKGRDHESTNGCEWQ